MVASARAPNQPSAKAPHSRACQTAPVRRAVGHVARRPRERRAASRARARAPSSDDGPEPPPALAGKHELTLRCVRSRIHEHTPHARTCSGRCRKQLHDRVRRRDDELTRLADLARGLVRSGDITGDDALALVLWPTPMFSLHLKRDRRCPREAAHPLTGSASRSAADPQRGSASHPRGEPRQAEGEGGMSERADSSACGRRGGVRHRSTIIDRAPAIEITVEGLTPSRPPGVSGTRPKSSGCSSGVKSQLAATHGSSTTPSS